MKVIKYCILFFIIAVFSVNAQTVTLDEPTDTNSVSLTPELTFDVSGFTMVDSIFLYISTDSQFNNLLNGKRDTLEVLPSNSGNGSYTISLSTQLSYDKYYWWKVKVDNQISVEENFKTITDLKPILSLPLDDAKVYTKTPKLTWYLSVPSDGTEYELQFDTDSDFSDVTPIEDIDSLSYKASTELTPAQEYFWRVRSKNSDDNYSEWSGIRSFTVDENLGPVKPILTWPINDPTVYTTTPTLFWISTSSNQNLEYEVSIKEESGSYSILGTTSDTYFEVPSGNLESGKKYNWIVKVREGSSGAFDNSSDEETFTLYESLSNDPVKPISSWPVGDVVVYDNKVQLNWYLIATGTGLKYEIRYDTDENTGNGYEETIDGITDLFHEISDLEGDQTYTWQVRSYIEGSPNDYSEWSDEATFKTHDVLPGELVKPVNVLPVDEADVYQTDVLLSWTYSGTFSGIDFLITVSEDNTVDENDPQFVSTKLSKLIENLESGKAYYWKVQARKIDTGELSTASDVTSFSIDNPYTVTPVQPTLYFPTNGMTISSKTVNMSWSVNALSEGLSYHLEWTVDGFGFDDDPDIPQVGSVDITDCSTTYEIALPETGTYNWKVLSFIDDGNDVYDGTEDASAYSEIKSFSIVSSASAVQPIVGSPNNVIIETSNPTVSWYTPNAADDLKYRLEVSDKADLSDMVAVYDDIEANQFTIENLEDKTYFWRVSSKTDDGVYSLSSRTGSFSVNNVTDFDENTILPIKFRVEQNYPNPFNPSTNISFTIGEDNFVTVKIYNLLGEEVRTLVSKELTKGSHLLKWNGIDNDGKAVATGIYLYKVKSGENLSVRKMMLLK